MWYTLGMGRDQIPGHVALKPHLLLMQVYPLLPPDVGQSYSNCSLVENSGSSVSTSSSSGSPNDQRAPDIKENQEAVIQVHWKREKIYLKKISYSYLEVSEPPCLSPLLFHPWAPPLPSSLSLLSPPTLQVSALVTHPTEKKKIIIVHYDVSALLLYDRDPLFGNGAQSH